MKIAIISDLHISNRHFGPISIISQTKSLAKRLCSYCKSNSVPELIIAGDIVDKAIDRSCVYHCVQEVFEIFSSNFTNVYYILGQHDCCVDMSSKIDYEDTIITALSKFNNVKYVDGSILRYPNCSVGFANYCRNPVYSLPEDVDLYVTHFTISNRFGQYIDRSHFKLMIAGDIHHIVDDGNLHSIGSFQQQSVTKDSDLNNVCIFDTDTITFDRVDIGGGVKLRYSEDNSGLIDNVWYIYRRKPKSDSPSSTEISKLGDNYSKIVEKVREFMESKGLTDLNNEVANNIKVESNFSTEFTINSVEVHNFLKIKDVKVEFQVGDKVLLTGNNGSGKSTFLNAIYAGLTGNLTMAHYVGKFDSEMYIEVSLTYCGLEYTLRRGSGYQYLKCNGDDVKFKNRNDFNSVVLSRLPFISDLGILFQRPEVGTLFEGINSNAKLKLISKIYHLEYLDLLFTGGDTLRVNKINELRDNRNLYESKKLKLSEIETKLSELSEVKDMSLTELTNRRSELIELKSKSDEYSKVSKILESKKAQLSLCDTMIELNKTKLSDLDEELYQSQVNELKSISEINSKLIECKRSLTSNKTEIASITSKITSLENNKCPTCGNYWNSDESIKLLSELKSRLTELEIINEGMSKYISDNSDKVSKYDSLVDSIKSFEVTKSTYLNSINDANKSKSEIEEYISNLNLPDKIEFTEDDLNELLKITEDINKISEYMTLDESRIGTLSEITPLELTISKLDEDIHSLSDYLWYVSKSGPIYKDIITDLCDSWSNDRVKFSLFEGMYRGNPYLDIKISYLKGLDWQDYSMSSSGEKSYMDILFIKSVTSNAGFLILDEFLRHMDSELTEAAIDEIKSMNVGLFILSSFNPNLYFSNINISAKYIQEDDECRITVS